MSDAAVELRLRGAGLHPETLRASDLAQVLVCFEKAIEAAATVLPSEDEPRPVVVSLTAVRDGSACLELTVSPAVWDAVVTVARSIEDREYGRLPRAAQTRLADLSKFAVGRGWEAELVSPSLRRAVISASNPVPHPPPSRLRGTTTLVGQCVRVGGVEPGVQVRPLRGGKLVTVQARKELVKELGERLYETVALEGEAVWDPDSSWEMTEFRAARLLPYRPHDPLAAFRALATAAGEAWKDVDAEEYVRAARSEDDGSS